MQTIYIDVLIILNIYVNYFLLRTAARITHSPLSTLRCIAASAFGSLFSLTILLPPLNGIVSTLLRIFSAAAIMLAAFGWSDIRRLIMNTAAFFIANFLLAGSVYAVSFCFAPEFVHINNGCFYIDFSLLILILTTAAMYAIVWAARVISGRLPAEQGKYRVLVRYRNIVVNMAGLADTGNVLVDMFTGVPVIVCGREQFSEFIPDKCEKLPRGFRYIPCCTVSESGVMPVFCPDEILILNSADGSRKPVEAMIGLGECPGTAIFNPGLLKF